LLKYKLHLVSYLSKWPPIESAFDGTQIKCFRNENYVRPTENKASGCLGFVKWSVDGGPKDFEYKLDAERVEERSAKVSGVVNRNLLFIHRRWHRNRGKCHKLSQNINIEPRNECHISCTLCSGIGLHNAGPVELWLQRYEAEIPSRPWRVVIFHILLGWNIVASSASGEVCQKLETATISRWVILLVMPFWGLPYAYWPKIYSAIRNYGLPFAFPWCYLFN